MEGWRNSHGQFLTMGKGFVRDKVNVDCEYWTDLSKTKCYWIVGVRRS